MNNMMLGMISMASFVATLFFLKFFKNTGDKFFLYFAGAFAIETFSRIGLALTNPMLEDFPTFYLMRLGSFTLILTAIIQKNRGLK